MIGAERERVLEIRSTGTVASDVIRDVLAVLDVEESMLDVALGDEDERDEARNARVRARGHLRPPRRDARPAARVGRRRAGVRASASPPGCTGSRCAAASPAGRWPAATPRPSGTPPSTSTRPRTRSCSRPSPARTGAGATCTTSPAEPSRRTARGRGPNCDDAPSRRSGTTRRTSCGEPGPAAGRSGLPDPDPVDAHRLRELAVLDDLGDLVVGARACSGSGTAAGRRRRPWCGRSPCRRSGRCRRWASTPPRRRGSSWTSRPSCS